MTSSYENRRSLLQGGDIATEQIDYTVYLLYKRLSARFSIETMERHWERAVEAAKCRTARHRFGRERFAVAL